MRRLLPAIVLFTTSAFGQTTISSIYPASGPTSGGTFVHILGTDLLGLPLACPAIECANYVRFGDALGTININSATEIVAQTPPHAVGTVDVTVNIAGKARIPVPAAFRYDAPGTDSEQILLPLVLSAPVSGAYGSVWKGEVVFHNASSEEVPVSAPNCNPSIPAPCPPPLKLSPQSTQAPTLYPLPGPAGGLLIYVPRRNIHDLDISLRVQDISRQAQTWGTAIPVVRSTDYQSIARLIGIPTDSRFRTTLRVYHYGGSAGSPITVRVFDPSSSQPLVDTRFELRATQDPQTYPGYLQIDGLTDVFPGIRGHEVVRVEVASASVPPELLWAFISVTNNETQHVTLITPSSTATP
jgi:hypothetical protein